MESVVCQKCERADTVIELLQATFVCGHYLCVDCVGEIFNIRPKDQCRVCHKEIERSDFKQRTEEDNLAEDEMRRRTNLKETFNLKRKDFEGTPQYEDYRAEVEDIIELKEPEYSERVALFKKEHHHKIAVNKSRDVNSQFGHPKARQQVQRPDLQQAEAQGLMGPPLTRMPTELNRNNPGNIDPNTLLKKKTYGGGFLTRWPQERAWQEMRRVFE